MIKTNGFFSRIGNLIYFPKIIGFKSMRYRKRIIFAFFLIGSPTANWAKPRFFIGSPTANRERKG